MNSYLYISIYMYIKLLMRVFASMYKLSRVALDLNVILKLVLLCTCSLKQCIIHPFCSLCLFYAYVEMIFSFVHLWSRRNNFSFFFYGVWRWLNTIYFVYIRFCYFFLIKILLCLFYRQLTVFEAMSTVYLLLLTSQQEALIFPVSELLFTTNFRIQQRYICWNYLPVGKSLYYLLVLGIRYLLCIP